MYPWYIVCTCSVDGRGKEKQEAGKRGRKKERKKEREKERKRTLIILASQNHPTIQPTNQAIDFAKKIDKKISIRTFEYHTPRFSWLTD